MEDYIKQMQEYLNKNSSKNDKNIIDGFICNENNHFQEEDPHLSSEKDQLYDCFQQIINNSNNDKKKQENKMFKILMKIDGNRFYMKDSVGNEYLVECKRDKVVKDYIHTNVIDFRNNKLLKEELNKMKQLAGYKSSNVQTRIDESTTNENERTRKMLDKTKNFINK